MSEKIKKDKDKRIKREHLAIILLIILLPIVIVAPIGITNAVVSNNRGKEILQNRVEWSLQLSYEVYNVNRTTLCGCNYTDSILVISVSFSEWDNHSAYFIYVEDVWVATIYGSDILASEPRDCMEIRLNRTSLLIDKEIYRHPVFNNWTKEYDVRFEEYFGYRYKVIAWWHKVEFSGETQIATFSISNGFNWK